MKQYSDKTFEYSESCSKECKDMGNSY